LDGSGGIGVIAAAVRGMAGGTEWGDMHTSHWHQGLRQSQQRHPSNYDAKGLYSRDIPQRRCRRGKGKKKRKENIKDQL
jgi:hypothetical protein